MNEFVQILGHIFDGQTFGGSDAADQSPLRIVDESDYMSFKEKPDNHTKHGHMI